MLKGPVFDRWLYGDGDVRLYADSDILVAPARAEHAAEAMLALGFHAQTASEYGALSHAQFWARGEELVDLHTSLLGATVEREAVWAALSRDTESFALAGVTVEGTGPTASALVAALHVTAHGAPDQKAREDLARAIERTDGETWRAARRLAIEIGSEESFAAGLRTLPAGTALAEQLDLPVPVSVEVILRAQGFPAGTGVLERLRSATWRMRVKLLAQAVVPDPEYIREWSAKRGRERRARCRRVHPPPLRRRADGRTCSARTRRCAQELDVIRAVAICAALGAAFAWPSSNGDLSNTRVASTSIVAANVATLKLVWTARIDGVGGAGLTYASTPIVSGGAVYTQDLASTVTAYRARDGRMIWRHAFPGEPDVGPNGVTLEAGRLYGATNDYAFALSARTGALLWRSASLVRNEHEGIDMAPAVSRGVLYVSTVPGNVSSYYTGGSMGRLFALDASNGKIRWRFDTVPSTLWGDPAKNAGGGLWYAPAIAKDGSLYADVANPAPFPDASSRPGPNPHTDSLVKLDARTGKLVWARQMLPHDVYDWDLEAPPVVTRNLVLSAGKMGFVYATDAKTGKLVWKRAVGIHNGHDHDAVAALGVVVYPGVYGGVISPLAVAGGTAYVPVVDIGQRWKPVQTEWSTAAGEMTAIDVASGRVRWTTKLGSPVFGSATVANDLVFTTTYDGRLLALARATGRVAWTYRLPTGTIAPVAIAGDLLVTAATVPGHGGPELMAFRLPPR